MRNFVGTLWSPHKLERHIMYEILVMMARTNNLVEAKPEIAVEMIRAEANLERDLFNAIISTRRVV